MARAQGLPLSVDNPVPTPVLARVFDQGADISVHSATKYIGGHGVHIGGALVDSGVSLPFSFSKGRLRAPFLFLCARQGASS